MEQVVNAPDEGDLAVEVTGHPAGRAIFLLHGTPGSLLGPRPRGIYLYRLGIRLISYNRPGYPGSTRKIGRTVADAASDVLAIADRLGIEEFSVIGRSGGAPHALACAADERLRERLICTAALSSLAPQDAGGLDWYADMVESNKTAYHNAAEADLQALVATFKPTADKLRNSSQGLLNTLQPELAGSDRRLIGDMALRRIIARTHADALRLSVDGWVDDVIALARPWKVDFSAITAPVLLWHGRSDIFSPTSHTEWLHEQIKHSQIRLADDKAHFEAIKVLPEILSWVMDKVREATPASFPYATPASSERLRSDHAREPAVAESRGNVRVLSPERVG